jgi:Double sensory domain of two-component sensor kinase
MNLSSIRLKLILFILLVLALSGAASGVLINSVYERGARTASEEALRAAESDFQELDRSETDKIIMTLKAVVANPAIRDAFAARDREKLQALSLPIHQQFKAEHGVAHWNYIEEPSRQMFLRPHLPAKFGDVVDRANVIKCQARHEAVADKGLGKSAFALRVCYPFMADGKVIGYVELGEEMDHFLDKMKSQTGNEFAMFFSKKLIDQSEWARTRGTSRNNWNDFTDVVVVKSTMGDSETLVDEDAIQKYAAGSTTLPDKQSDGATYSRGVFPVKDSTGTVVGGLVVRHNISELRKAMTKGVWTAVGILLVLAVAAAGLVFLLVNFLIFRRLTDMRTTMEDLSVRLAGGDYSVAATAGPPSNDELGSFEAFFQEFLNLVANTMREMATRLKQRQAARPVPPPSTGT